MKYELERILSKREYEVFLLVANGLPTKKISDCLILKANTISTIKKKIHFKIGTQSDIEIFKMAYKHRLVKL